MTRRLIAAFGATLAAVAIVACGGLSSHLTLNVSASGISIPLDCVQNHDSVYDCRGTVVGTTVTAPITITENGDGSVQASDGAKTYRCPSTGDNAWTCDALNAVAPTAVVLDGNEGNCKPVGEGDENSESDTSHEDEELTCTTTHTTSSTSSRTTSTTSSASSSTSTSKTVSTSSTSRLSSTSSLAITCDWPTPGPTPSSGHCNTPSPRPTGTASSTSSGDPGTRLTQRTSLPTPNTGFDALDWAIVVGIIMVVAGTSYLAWGTVDIFFKRRRRTIR